MKRVMTCCVLLACGLAGGDEMELKTLKAENAALRRQVKGLRVQVAELKAGTELKALEAKVKALTAQVAKARATTTRPSRGGPDTSLRETDTAWWRDAGSLGAQVSLRVILGKSWPNECAPTWLARNKYFKGQAVRWTMQAGNLREYTPTYAAEQYHVAMAKYVRARGQSDSAQKTVRMSPQRKADAEMEARRRRAGVDMWNGFKGNGGGILRADASGIYVVLIIPAARVATARRALAKAGPDKHIRVVGQIVAVLRSRSHSTQVYLTGEISSVTPAKRPRGGRK